MTKPAEPIVVADGVVVSLDYRLHLDNGEPVDDSEDGGPLEFLQGHGRHHLGVGAGDLRYGGRRREGYRRGTATVTANMTPRRRGDSEQRVSSAVEGIARSGYALQTQDESDDVMVVYVSEIRPNSVLIDLNHPLAGRSYISGSRSPLCASN